MKRISSRLIEKSKEALLLGVEIYNKPTVQYRLESFSIFYTNAWELLMKAKIVEDTKNESSIFIPTKRWEKSKRQTISFEDALKRVFPSETDPVRKNISDVQDLRNSSAHFIVEDVELIYSWLFQQWVLNYLRHLRTWFNQEINITPRMLSLVFEFQPQNITPVRIRSKYPKDVQSFIEEKRERILWNIETLWDKYSIPINSRLFISKNRDPEGIDLSINGTGESSIVTVEVPKDFTKTHPFSPEMAAEEVNKLLPEKIKSGLKNGKVTGYEITAIKGFLNLKPESNWDYFYELPLWKKWSQPKYSKKFAEDMAKRIEHESDFMSKARGHRARKGKKRL